MSDPNPDAIAGNAMIFDPHEHIPEIAHLIVEANHDRGSPGLIRHRTNVFNRQSVESMRTILGIRGHDVRAFACLQLQIRRKQHDSRQIVRAKADRSERRKWLALVSCRIEGYCSRGRLFAAKDWTIGLRRYKIRTASVSEKSIAAAKTDPGASTPASTAAGIEMKQLFPLVSMKSCRVISF